MSLLALVARMLVGMALVLAVMALAGKAMRRKALPGLRRHRMAPIEVLARQGLGRTASVAMVKAGGKVWFLGITDTNVNLLGEADELGLLADDGPDANWTALPGHGHDARTSWTWKAMMDAARERTVRR